MVYPGAEGAALDAHPLVRDYLAQALRERQPDAWREGHRRLYEQLKASVPYRPEGLAGLQPLYQAVVHGCLAGMQQEALVEVYRERILRGTGPRGFYSTRNLGAFGTDLGAVACFFADTWRRPALSLSEADQAWLLNAAAFRLRALGRLDEALEPMRNGAEMLVKQNAWKKAAAVYGNLSELQLTLGWVTAAVDSAGQAVAYANRNGDAFQRVERRATLADALHQHGEREAAAALFEEAETLQTEQQPEHPLLYSLRGFRYCDLLLAGAERAFWRGPVGDAAIMRRCGEVTARAAQTLQWYERNRAGALTPALDQLTLARCTLYAALLQGEPLQAGRRETDCALDGLRAAAQQDHIPRGLLTRAWLRYSLGDPSGAEADLAEAEQIAARGNMRLHLADIHLTRAHLFRDRSELARARALIGECEYWRRLPELEDAEAALTAGTNPASPLPPERSPSP